MKTIFNSFKSKMGLETRLQPFVYKGLTVNWNPA